MRNMSKKLLLVIIIMKSNNYQFSFNLTSQVTESSQDNAFNFLIKDIFPYLQIKSSTFLMFLLSLISFAIEISYSTIFPDPNHTIKNTFFLTFCYSIIMTIFLRLGSQYQQRLGSKYFIILFIIIQLVHFIGSMTIHIESSLFILGNSSALSIYIISIIDLNKLNQNEIIEFQKQKKIVVENCDLLDLNDTIIKLKPKDINFTYQSYTNREFYYHNIPSSQEKHKITPRKSIAKNSIKNPTLSKIIEEPLAASEDESMEIKIYKLILFHFILYAHQSNGKFILFVISEAIIYILLTTKFIRRISN